MNIITNAYHNEHVILYCYEQYNALIAHDFDAAMGWDGSLALEECDQSRGYDASEMAAVDDADVDFEYDLDSVEFDEHGDIVETYPCLDESELYCAPDEGNIPAVAFNDHVVVYYVHMERQALALAAEYEVLMDRECDVQREACSRPTHSVYDTLPF